MTLVTEQFINTALNMTNITNLLDKLQTSDNLVTSDKLSVSNSAVSSEHCRGTTPAVNTRLGCSGVTASDLQARTESRAATCATVLTTETHSGQQPRSTPPTGTRTASEHVRAAPRARDATCARQHVGATRGTASSEEIAQTPLIAGFIRLYSA